MISIGVLDKLKPLLCYDFDKEAVQGEAIRLVSVIIDEHVNPLQAVVEAGIFDLLVRLVYPMEGYDNAATVIRILSNSVATAMLERSHYLISYLRKTGCVWTMIDAVKHGDRELDEACLEGASKVLEKYHPQIEYLTVGEDQVERFDPKTIFDNGEPPEEFIWVLRKLVYVVEKLQFSFDKDIRRAAYQCLLDFFKTPVATEMPKWNLQ